jgi:hypothetical protein
VTVDDLAKSFSLPADRIQIALAKLEGEGFAMQGQFTPGESTGRDAGGPQAEMPASQLPYETTHAGNAAVDFAGGAWRPQSFAGDCFSADTAPL